MLSRGVGLRGFESHPPHHGFNPHNSSEILKFPYLKAVYVLAEKNEKDPGMRSPKTIVRYSTESDLPNIERHYGPLDNVGDPFCDTKRIPEVRLDWLIIAEVAGEYAGFLYWHLGEKPFFAPKIARFAHIREVQVLERIQGRGVGKKLMVYALGRLKALGVQDIFLATAETNDAARHLYESLGFTQFRKQIQYVLRNNDQPENGAWLTRKGRVWVG